MESSDRGFSDRSAAWLHRPDSRFPTSCCGRRSIRLYGVRKRAVARIWKDPDAITGMHRAFAELGELASHVIDNSGLDAAETADQVRRAVASGGYRLT